MSLNHETTFLYLGHSTVLITTPTGKRILLDCWTSSNPLCPAAYKSVDSLGKLDLILLTHLHNDHAGDAQAIVNAHPETPVIAIYEACNWLQTKGAKNCKPMNKGGTQTVAGISVTMTHAFHSSSFQEADGTVVYGGEPAGFVVKLENEFTFYAAGDTALFGDMALIRELNHPTLALLPIGDTFTMGPREAAHAARLLGVADVIPIHHGTFPALTGTPEAFQEALAGQPDITVHPLQPGETLR